MRIKKDFVLREVCGETVVFCEGLKALDFSRMLVLNESAVWLWNEAHAQGDFTIESLANKLCEEYDVTTDEAKAAVAELVAAWQKEDIIE